MPPGRLCPVASARPAAQEPRRRERVAERHRPQVRRHPRPVLADDPQREPPVVEADEPDGAPVREALEHRPAAYASACRVFHMLHTVLWKC